MPNIRYENGETTLWPGPVGAHSWQPMSYNPNTGLVYLPTIELPAGYNDKAINLSNWTRVPGNAVDNCVDLSFTPDLPGAGTSYLQAWDPVRQRSAWRVSTPSFWNGGTMSTGGNLVFQGPIDSKFNAYAADTGRLTWSFDAGAAVIAPPITYSVGGRQYVVAAGHAPDLRSCFAPTVDAWFKLIVQEGSSVANGMPRFEEFTDAQLQDLRHFIEAQAHAAAAQQRQDSALMSLRPAKCEPRHRLNQF